MPYTRIVGWYDVELKCLDYVVGCSRCMCYKNCENYEWALICYEMLKCEPHLFELWWKDLYKYNSYWAIDDDDCTRGRPYGLN